MFLFKYHVSVYIMFLSNSDLSDQCVVSDVDERYNNVSLENVHCHRDLDLANDISAIVSMYVRVPLFSVVSN